MVAIPKAFACVVTVLVAGLAAEARAEDVWAKWAETVRGEIKQVQTSVEKMIKEFRDVRCPQQQTQEQQKACIAAYNTIVALMNVKQTQLEIKLLAIPLPPAERDQIIQKAANSFAELNKQTVSLGDQVYLQFPVPQQSSQPVK